MVLDSQQITELEVELAVLQAERDFLQDCIDTENKLPKENKDFSALNSLITKVHDINRKTLRMRYEISRLKCQEIETSRKQISYRQH